MNLFSYLFFILNFFLSFQMSSFLNIFDQHKSSSVSREIISMMIDLLLYFKNVRTKKVVSNLYDLKISLITSGKLLTDEVCICKWKKPQPKFWGQTEYDQVQNKLSCCPWIRTNTEL